MPPESEYVVVKVANGSTSALKVLMFEKGFTLDSKTSDMYRAFKQGIELSAWFKKLSGI